LPFPATNLTPKRNGRQESEVNDPLVFFMIAVVRSILVILGIVFLLTLLLFLSRYNKAVSNTPSRVMCVDLCGDSQCQSISCLVQGCPCSETATTCPIDCK
jgi:hypothetical protein